MDDDEFEWSQGWVDLYWAEVDETLRIRKEELRNQRVGEKRKGSGAVPEGPEKKKLKVSNNYLFLGVTDCHSLTRTTTLTMRRARCLVSVATRSRGLVSVSQVTRPRQLPAWPVSRTR